MNQHQRKFLLEAIEKQYKIERSALHDRKPNPPSLNNYLIASVLDGSFTMKSESVIREAIRARVRDLGKGDAFVETASRSFRTRDYDDEEVISIPAKVMFDMPLDYVKAFSEFEGAMKSWRKEADALEASIEAMRIKVQIGSDKALEALVEQADTLCSMSLTTTNKLLLGSGKPNQE